ncbi:DNA methyltransferase Dim-2 [Blyttiomyces sp. JEL0837]|nr:DNA methyltransferase Dim-2 [Blyttiomyces sp. JEL0837]
MKRRTSVSTSFATNSKRRSHESSMIEDVLRTMDENRLQPNLKDWIKRLQFIEAASDYIVHRAGSVLISDFVHTHDDCFDTFVTRHRLPLEGFNNLSNRLNALWEYSDMIKTRVNMLTNSEEFWQSLQKRQNDIRQLQDSTDDTIAMAGEQNAKCNVICPRVTYFFPYLQYARLRSEFPTNLDVNHSNWNPNGDQPSDQGMDCDDNISIDSNDADENVTYEIGDHVELCNADKDCFWFSRITDVSDWGVRMAHFWKLNQTCLKDAGQDRRCSLHLMYFLKKLLATRTCECREKGWFPFHSIRRKITVIYQKQNVPLPGEPNVFYCTLLYDLDKPWIGDLPDEFFDLQASPLEICQCSDGALETGFPSANDDVAKLHRNIAICKTKHYKPGEFYKLTRQGKDKEDIIEIHRFTFDETHPRLEYRVFGRPNKSEMLSGNELVWNPTIEVFNTWEEILMLNGDCHVEHVPADYDFAGSLRFNGSGHRYFFRNAHVGHYPPPPPRIRLKTLDLFCGAGNFSLGLEESGAAFVTKAVDFDADAVSTYNKRYLKTGRQPAVLSSVNQFLAKQVTEGKESFDLRLASPPCQDFSLLKRERQESGREIVVQIANAIELFRPKYAIVENVSFFIIADNFLLTKHGPKWSEQDSTAHHFTFLYLSSSLLATKYGGQSFRVELTGLAKFAIAGSLYVLRLAALYHPYHFHHTSIMDQLGPIMQNHPEDVGNPPNDKRSGKDVIGNLPEPTIGKKNHKYPHHSISKIRASNDISEDLRIDPDGYLFTVTTKGSSGRTKKKFHYAQNRTLTLYECALAQGFFPEEIGLLQGRTKASLWRQVGNAIPKGLAFALGCELAKVLPKRGGGDADGGRDNASFVWDDPGSDEDDSGSEEDPGFCLWL